MEPSRLERSLGLPDAVVIGLGAMIGAGVFAAVGPAAAAAGSGLLIGLGLAAVVAYCNATSSAQLAAVHPAAGGTYVYGRERLGPVWGYLAGVGFVVGKTASCAAMALTFGFYAAPAYARPLGIGAVVALTAVNYRGVRKTAWLTRVIVAVVLSALVAVVASSLLGGEADTTNLRIEDVSFTGVLRAAGLLFFAFAGYARIATLGEEVSDPARVIPRAIPIALGITLVVYAAVALSALVSLGPEALARSEAPLVEAVPVGWAWVVRAGATVASLGVLLSLLVGVSRTLFAMAADRERPSALASVHPRFRTPYKAEIVVAAVVCLFVGVTDLRDAIGFSSFCVLVYYAITNASALRLGPHERRWPRALALLGMAGCLLLAFSLPWTSIRGGLFVLGVGLVGRAVERGRTWTPGRP
jgi:basic amino acid/polyamine antiporter, APA family